MPKGGVLMTLRELLKQDELRVVEVAAAAVYDT